MKYLIIPFHKYTISAVLLAGSVYGVIHELMLPERYDPDPVFQLVILAICLVLAFFFLRDSMYAGWLIAIILGLRAFGQLSEPVSQETISYFVEGYERSAFLETIGILYGIYLLACSLRIIASYARR